MKNASSIMILDPKYSFWQRSKLRIQLHVKARQVDQYDLASRRAIAWSRFDWARQVLLIVQPHDWPQPTFRAQLANASGSKRHFQGWVDLGAHLMQAAVKEVSGRR